MSQKWENFEHFKSVWEFIVGTGIAGGYAFAQRAWIAEKLWKVFKGNATESDRQEALQGIRDEGTDGRAVVELLARGARNTNQGDGASRLADWNTYFPFPTLSFFPSALDCSLMSFTGIMDQYSNLYERRDTLEVLAPRAPTPLLQKQMRKALDLFEKAIKAPDRQPFIEDLETSYARISARWTVVNKDIFTSARVHSNIAFLRNFLISKLFEDYVNRPFSASEKELEICKQILDSSETRMYDANTVQLSDGIIHIDEMALDTPWVKKKLAAAVSRRGEPQNNAESFIDHCDWSNLASLLLNDIEVLHRLREYGLCTEESFNTIQKGIDEIRKKYSIQLQSTTDYTLSIQAHQQTQGISPLWLGFAKVLHPLTIRKSEDKKSS